MLTVFLYLFGSLILAVIGSIIFGHTGGAESEGIIDSTINGSLLLTVVMTTLLVLVSLFVFKKSTKKIYFEPKKFELSKLYYIYPAFLTGIILLRLFSSDFTQINLLTITLLVVASLGIGASEELVTRGILLAGLRNDRRSEWAVWLVSTLAFTLLHLVNLISGGSVLQLFITFFLGTLLYISRRVFGNIFVPILLHAAYDFSLYLLVGNSIQGESLPENVASLEFGVFLATVGVFIMFVVFGRNLLKSKRTGIQ